MQERGEDEDVIAGFGKELDADKVLLVNIIKRGETYNIYEKLFDVASKKVQYEDSADVEEFKIIETVTSLFNGFVQRLSEAEKETAENGTEETAPETPLVKPEEESTHEILIKPVTGSEVKQPVVKTKQIKLVKSKRPGRLNAGTNNAAGIFLYDLLNENTTFDLTAIGVTFKSYTPGNRDFVDAKCYVRIKQ